MNIVYLHGKESSPNNTKRQKLESMGHRITAPFLEKDDWAQSVHAAHRAIEEAKPELIIASSRGAAVAMATNTTAPLILIAPAWAKYCPWGACRANTIIIHSKNDEIIPFKHSQRLAHSFGALLLEAGNNHRMNSKDVYETLAKIIENKTKTQ